MMLSRYNFSAELKVVGWIKLYPSQRNVYAKSRKVETELQTSYIQVSFSSCSMASVIMLNEIIVLSAVTCSFFSMPIFFDCATSELGSASAILFFPSSHTNSIP